MPHPLLYEINTRCWLRELSQRSAKAVNLGSVPETEFASWAKAGFTHIWLMGVWTTGKRSRAEALRAGSLREAYQQLLPDWTEADVPGSPYAIAEYRVPPALGGDSGLEAFRAKLNQQGMKLILDFVPNHLGLDHACVQDRPELFVQSTTQTPDTFVQETTQGVRWLAYGKDPYFPGWTDTVQLDYRRTDTREAMIALLEWVAEKCDGVRCDMAMLLLNEVFAKTWERYPRIKLQASSFRETGNEMDAARFSGNSPSPRLSPQGEGVAVAASGPNPDEEFWKVAISRVRTGRRDFLFLSEVYWGLEGRLQELGFDYTYDKELYDKIVARDAAGVQRHLLGASREYVAASAHFLENHDEPRVASFLSPAEHRAAALVILGLPGMRFLHEGQFGGARLKIPVQLGRRPAEAEQPEVEKMYEQILSMLGRSAVGKGRGEVLRPRAAWPDNPTGQNFVIVQWQNKPMEFDLVVVNLAPHRSQCYAPLGIEHLAERNWSTVDLLGEERYVRAGEDLEKQGLYLDVAAHGAQVFHFEAD